MELDPLITKLILDNSGYQTNLKASQTSTTNIGGNIKSALSGVGLGGVASFLSITGAIGGTVSVLKDVYKSTMEYGDAIREMSLLNGTTAEETSRLIQLTDDYKLSTDDLKLASRTLAKEGISLTTDELARMSDEYLALNNAADQQAYLMKNFGARGGTAFVEIMQQGGDAIRSQSSAINDNLILNQSQLDKQRELQFATDDLNDSWSALKLVLGEQLIPIFLSLANAMNAVVGINQNMTAEIYKTLGPLEKLVTFMSMNPIAWLNMLMTPETVNNPSQYSTGQTSPNATRPQRQTTPIKGGGDTLLHREASGGDYMVTTPTLFLAGEAGPERATFTPGGGDSMQKSIDELNAQLARLPYIIRDAVQTSQ